ncbi:MAG: rRNA maturation RNase YbeY [Thiotrichales bacterium]
MSLQIELQLVTEDASAPDQAQMQQWVDAWFPDSENLSVLVRIVDETESAALNETYRAKKGPTNVLSFPFDPPEMVVSSHLGDLVICAPIVAREAQSQSKPLAAHWAHLLLHGILHLQGYDHIEAADAQIMEALEIEKLALLGIPNPYIA